MSKDNLSPQPEWIAPVDNRLFNVPNAAPGEMLSRLEDGSRVTYDKFPMTEADSPWQMMPGDLGGAVAFLGREKGVPERKLGLIGASLGANVCLLYGVTNKSIPVIVLLSPGLTYAGLNSSDAIALCLSRPLAIAASPDDTYAFQSSQLLFGRIQKNRNASFFLGSDSQHGVQMLTDKFQRTLLQWLEKH